MPRKSEIQAEEAITSSPLRRSSRINVAANSQPSAETPEPKAPKTRRASLSQENPDKDDKKENKPAPRGRKGSTTKEETEPKPEPAKTRSRRSSANTEPAAKVEESKPITRRRRSSAAEDPPEPETVRPVRGRRSSITDKPEEEDAEKKNVRGKRIVKEETVKEEPVRKSVRGRRGSITDKTEENEDIETEKKKPTRGRRSSIDKLEDEPEVKTVKLTPSKSRRRLSVTDNVISLEPIEEQESETKGRKSNSPMKTELRVVVEPSPPKDETSEEKQSSSHSKASKSTPVKSRRRLSIAEVAVNLESIEEQESETRARKSISPEKTELRVVLNPSPTMSETSEEKQTKSDKSTPVKSRKTVTEVAINLEPIEEQKSEDRKSASPELRVVLSPSPHKSEASEEDKTYTPKSRRQLLLAERADNSEVVEREMETQDDLSATTYAAGGGSLTPVKTVTPDRLQVREKTNFELSVIQETSFMEEDPEESRSEEKVALRKSPRLQVQKANTPPPAEKPTTLRRSPRLNESTSKDDKKVEMDLDEETEDKDEDCKEEDRGESSNIKGKSGDSKAREDIEDAQMAPLHQEPDDRDKDCKEVSNKDDDRDESSNMKGKFEDAEAHKDVKDTQTAPLHQESKDRDKDRNEASKESEDREESSNMEVKSKDAEAQKVIEGTQTAPLRQESKDRDKDRKEASKKNEDREESSDMEVKSKDTEAQEDLEHTPRGPESHLEVDKSKHTISSENQEAVRADQVLEEQCVDVKIPEAAEQTDFGGKIEEISKQDTKGEVAKLKSDCPDISMGLDGSFKFHLDVSLSSTNSQNMSQREDIEEVDDLNVSKTSNGSDKENLDINKTEDETKQMKEKLKEDNADYGDIEMKAQNAVVARVSNVFRPKMKEDSFMEPMDVDESFVNTPQNKMPSDIEESNIEDAPPAKSTPVAARSVKKIEETEDGVVIISKNESRRKESTEIEECDSVDDSFKLSLSVSRISQQDDSISKLESKHLKESMAAEESKADTSDIIPEAKVIVIKGTESKAPKLVEPEGNVEQMNTPANSIKTDEQDDKTDESHRQKEEESLSKESENQKVEVNINEEMEDQSNDSKIPSPDNLESKHMKVSTSAQKEEEKSFSNDSKKNNDEEKVQSSDAKSPPPDDQKLKHIQDTSATSEKGKDVKEEPNEEDTKLPHIDQSCEQEKQGVTLRLSTESLIEDTKQKEPKNQHDLPGGLKENVSEKISENLDDAKLVEPDSNFSPTKTGLLKESKDNDNSSLAKLEALKTMEEGEIEEICSSTQEQNTSEKQKKSANFKATKIGETSDTSDTEAVQSPEVRKMDMSDEYEFDMPSDEEDVEKTQVLEETVIKSEDKESGEVKRKAVSSEDIETDKLPQDSEEPKSEKVCTDGEVESKESLEERQTDEKQEMVSNEEVLSSKDDIVGNINIPEESTEKLKTDDVTMIKELEGHSHITENLNEELSSKGVQDGERSDRNELEVESISTSQGKEVQSKDASDTTENETNNELNASAMKDAETEYEKMEKDFKDVVKDQEEQKTGNKDSGDSHTEEEASISPDLEEQGIKDSEKVSESLGQTESTDTAEETVSPDSKEDFEAKSDRKKWKKDKTTVNESEENVLELGHQKEKSGRKSPSEENTEDKVTSKTVTVYSKADSYEETAFCKTEKKNKYEETEIDYFVADSTNDVEENASSNVALQMKSSEVNTENEENFEKDEVRQGTKDSVESVFGNIESEEETRDEGKSELEVKTPKKKSKKSKKSKRNVENKTDETETEDVKESPVTEDMEDKEAAEDINALQAEKTEKHKKKRKRKLEHQRKDSVDDAPPRKRPVVSSNLEQFANSKLDEYLSRKISEMESEIDSYEDGSEEQEEESEREENEYICTMAEEGEEDTPSEGSNDIIDEGESLHSTESEIDSDSEYDEEDSFICDDEEHELLSGNEYDLDGEMKKKEKKSRIIQLDNYDDDDDVIKIERKEKPVEKKKRSRIITITDSSESENEHSQEQQEERLEAEEKTETAPKSPEPDTLEGDSSAKKTADDDVIILEEKSSPLIKPVVTEIGSSMSENDEDRLRKSKRKSSITIHENISVSEIKDAALSERISNLVDTFCTSIRKGEISMNLSLEYAGKDSLEESQQLKDEPPSDQKSSSLSDDIFIPPETTAQKVKKPKRGKKKAKKSPVDKPSVSISSEEGTSRKRADRLSVTLDNIEDSDESEKAAKKRRLSKSLENLNEMPVKKKKKKKEADKDFKKTKQELLMKISPKRTKKQKKQYSSEGDLRTQTFSIMNQLITDVKKRPVRRILPSRDTSDINDSWITEVADVRPSTTIITRRERTEYKSGKVHPKDFRSQMLYDPSRVKRVDTKTLLKKRGAYF